MTSDEQPHSSAVEIAVAVVTCNGKYLIGLRPPGVPLAGLWEFPGGKIQPGESPVDAAVRECREETGLAVQVTGSYPGVTHDYQHARVRLHFFQCAPSQPMAVVPNRFRWVPAAELLNYKFPPANVELLGLLTKQPD